MLTHRQTGPIEHGVKSIPFQNRLYYQQETATSKTMTNSRDLSMQHSATVWGTEKSETTGQHQIETYTLLTIPQVAKQLNISRAHVYKLIKQGLPTIHLGRSVRIHVSSLQRWLLTQEDTYDNNEREEVMLHKNIR